MILNDHRGPEYTRSTKKSRTQTKVMPLKSKRLDSRQASQLKGGKASSCFDVFLKFEAR
jgi:hypothetical protein